MLKAKFLYSELPTSLREAAELMLAQQYSEETGSGYLLSTSTNSCLSGKYVEKVVNHSVIENPFGEKSEIQSILYYTCRFNWKSDSKLLWISEPPRSIRKFINSLRDLFGLGLVIAEINPSPDKWFSEIEKDGANIAVTHISSFGIQTPNDSLAKVSVTARTDVRDDFKHLIGGRKHEVDCVKFSMNYDNEAHIICELTKTGMCKIKSSSTNTTLDKLRNALEASHSF